MNLVYIWETTTLGRHQCEPFASGEGFVLIRIMCLGANHKTLKYTSWKSKRADKSIRALLLRTRHSFWQIKTNGKGDPENCHVLLWFLSSIKISRNKPWNDVLMEPGMCRLNHTSATIQRYLQRLHAMTVHCPALNARCVPTNRHVLLWIIWSKPICAITSMPSLLIKGMPKYLCKKIQKIICWSWNCQQLLGVMLLPMY